MVRRRDRFAPVEPGKEGDGLVLRLRNGHSRVEAADERERVALHADVVHELRGEEIDPCAGGEDRAKVEGLGQYSDDGDRRVVERDRSSDDRAVAPELPLPEGIGQHYDGGVAFHGLLQGEVASECGLDAEDVEEVSCNRYACDGFGFVLRCQFVIVGG